MIIEFVDPMTNEVFHSVCSDHVPSEGELVTLRLQVPDLENYPKGNVMMADRKASIYRIGARHWNFDHWKDAGMHSVRLNATFVSYEK